MTVVSPYTYAQAIGALAPYWWLEITRWGNRGASSVPGELTYDGVINGPVAGVAIGPDSTVSEVIVGYNSVGPVFLTIAPFPGEVQAGTLTVGVNAPAGPLAGPLSVRVAMEGQFADTYMRDGATAASPFGAAEPLFEMPTLSLVCYAPSSPNPIVPATRAPLIRSFDVVMGAGAKTLVAIWPVSGRRRMRVSARAYGTAVGSFYVGRISYAVTTIAGLTVPRYAEVLSSGVAVDATTGAQGEWSSQEPCQFLALYYTRTAGAGNLQGVLTATD